MGISVLKSETEITTMHTGAAEIIFALLARLADPNKNFHKFFQERWNLAIELSLIINMTSYCESPENIKEFMELLAKARSIFDEWPDPIPPELPNKFTVGLFTADSIGPAKKSIIEHNFKLLENLFNKRST